jgi:hypothetical protein
MVTQTPCQLFILFALIERTIFNNDSKSGGLKLAGSGDLN